PGAFSTNGESSYWPTYELVSMKICPFFEDLKDSTGRDFLKLLGLGPDAKRSAWQADRYPGMILKLTSLRSRNWLPSVIFCREHDLPAAPIQEDRQALDEFAEEFLDSVDKTMALEPLKAAGLTY